MIEKANVVGLFLAFFKPCTNPACNDVFRSRRDIPPPLGSVLVRPDEVLVCAVCHTPLELDRTPPDAKKEQQLNFWIEAIRKAVLKADDVEYNLQRGYVTYENHKTHQVESRPTEGLTFSVHLNGGAKATTADPVV